MAFKKGQLRVLSHSWDRNLGGRDLDNALFEHFAAEFQEKYKLDVRTNHRASFRLRMGCEKVGLHSSLLLSSIYWMDLCCRHRAALLRSKFLEISPFRQRRSAHM